jgi:hypothetical protein
LAELVRLILLLAAATPGVAVGPQNFDDASPSVSRFRDFVTKLHFVMLVLGCVVFLECLVTVGFLHEPVPRIHDEFSYLLMGDTFASGRVANSSPPAPEFFETFHVLVRPTYASKYFPAQGLFLGLGQRLTGHPAVGVWHSSALACAAIYWMLWAWTSAIWGLLGGILMALQLGIYSYWSQKYWGGMAAALGGALVFGAIRRLWSRLSWQNSICLAVGVVILENLHGFHLNHP